MLQQQCRALPTATRRRHVMEECAMYANALPCPLVALICHYCHNIGVSAFARCVVCRRREEKAHTCCLKCTLWYFKFYYINTAPLQIPPTLTISHSNSCTAVALDRCNPNTSIHLKGKPCKSNGRVHITASTLRSKCVLDKTLVGMLFECTLASPHGAPPSVSTRVGRTLHLFVLTCACAMLISIHVIVS